MIKRVVYTEIHAVGFGRLAEIAPDVQVQMVDPNGGVIATDEVNALMVQHEDGVSVYVITDAVKSNLLKVLSGGVEVASPMEMSKALAAARGM